MDENGVEDARDFLDRILGEQGGAGGLESMGAAGDAIEAVLPSGPYPAGHEDQVQKAAEKVVRRQPMDAGERFALEAIIIPAKRPAVDIRKGDYQIEHKDWTHLNEEAAKRMIKAVIPSVGRIELPGHPSLPFGGTGFVVGDGLLMTNRHVAEIFTSGLGARGLAFRTGHRAGIDFDRERDGGSQFLEVKSVAMIHPYWDMALLRVEGLPASSARRLSVRDPDDLKGRDVVAIGYPAFDPRNDASVQNMVFHGVYDVKRLMPGKLSGRSTISSFGKKVPSAAHDSSTLGGASGSAVVDVATGEIVALHFAGIYLRSNYGVPTADLARDPRIVDAGVSFAGDASPGAGPWDEWWRDLEGVEAGERKPEPIRVAAAGGGSSSGVQAVAGRARGGGTSWTIPIEITVNAGALPPAGASDAAETGAVTPPPPVETMTERAVEPFHEEDYGNRTGYDPDFLDVAVPLPEPIHPDLVARLEDGEYVIPYHHFSIVMHRARRLALFTAANVDASAARKKPDAAQSYTRDALGGLGKDDRERWFADPRLRGMDQLPDRFFEKDNSAFDKGHLVRREDVAWGDSYAEVRAANGDTFHTTNCSPQVAGFNRSNHKDNWGALEDLVLRQASSERLCVFAGPVLSADDRRFVGVDERSTVKIQIPEEYWKIVVAADGAELQSFAFLLKQELSQTPLEFQVPTAWTYHMVGIEELEARLGTIRFPKAVRKADQKGQETGEAVRMSV